MKWRYPIVAIIFCMFCVSAYAAYRIYLVNEAADYIEQIGGSYGVDFIYGFGPRSVSLVTWVPGPPKSTMKSAQVRETIDKMAGSFTRLRSLNISHAGLDADDTLYAIQKLEFNELRAQDADFDTRCLDAVLQKKNVTLLAISASHLSPEELFRLKESKSLVYLHMWNVPYTEEEIASIQRVIGAIKYKFIRSSGY